MSVFGGILLYVAGVGTGSGLLIAHRLYVNRETAPLRRANKHLEECAWKDRLQHETERAYNDGFREGRLSPANDAERFAEFVQERNVDFRGQRRRDRRVQADQG